MPTWSRETAYATGLVATDGYITAPTLVGFCSTDKELVETFLHCVDRPVRYTTEPAGQPGNIGGRAFTTKLDYHQALFRDRLLYQFLEAAGITPRKSRTLADIKAPPELLPDVIRGLLDGDGSVITTLNAGAHDPLRRLRLRVIFASGSRAHLEWLRTVLANLAIRSSIQEDRAGANPFFRLVLTDRQATTLLTAVYEDPRAPRLHRKWRSWERYRQARSLPEYCAFV